jgi:hypothetical protein
MTSNGWNKWHLVWDRRGAYRIFLERPEGRRLLGRPRRRWTDNIKKWEARDVVWSTVAQYTGKWQTVVNAV